MSAARHEPARVEAVVHGRVHGVGYRAYVRDQAFDLGLLGWVRNESDGTVRVVAEGPRAQIERLLDALHVGPRLARVGRVDETWTPPEDRHGGFEVRR